MRGEFSKSFEIKNNSFKYFNYLEDFDLLKISIIWTPLPISIIFLSSFGRGVVHHFMKFNNQ